MSNIWITGATGGIGGACWKALAEHDIYPMTGDYDVRSPYMIRTFLDGRSPDVLVYAAGRNVLEWSNEIASNVMMSVYEVNVVGLVNCIQAAPSLSKVAVIGSDAAQRPMRTSIAYNASKAALEAAVKVIARERASEGFIINVVAPGLIEGTDMTTYVYSRSRQLRPLLNLEQYMLGGIPAGRAGRAEEVGEVVRWLVEDAPDYLNGAVINVNGGR